jgi:hypothetical protein
VQARYCSLLLVLAGHASRPGQGRARAAITTSHAPRICCWRRNDNPRAEHLHLCLAVTPIRQQPQHACVHACIMAWLVAHQLVQSSTLSVSRSRSWRLAGGAGAPASSPSEKRPHTQERGRTREALLLLARTPAHTKRASFICRRGHHHI